MFLQLRYLTYSYNQTFKNNNHGDYVRVAGASYKVYTLSCFSIIVINYCATVIKYRRENLKIRIMFRIN